MSFSRPVNAARRFAPPLLLLLLCAILSGCGGGGGGSNTTVNAAGAGPRQETRAASLGVARAARSLGAQFAVLSPSFFSRSRAVVFAETAQKGRRAENAALPFDEATQLYYQVQEASSNRVQIAYFADAGGANAVGSMRLLQEGNSGSFPQSSSVEITVEGGISPVRSTIEHAQDSATTGRLRGSIEDLLTGERTDFDLEVRDDGAVSGSLSARDRFNGNYSFDKTTLAPNTLTTRFQSGPFDGEVHIAADGSGDFTASGDDGPYSASWNASGGAIIRYPDGTTETIPDIDSFDPARTPVQTPPQETPPAPVNAAPDVQPGGKGILSLARRIISGG